MRRTARADRAWGRGLTRHRRVERALDAPPGASEVETIDVLVESEARGMGERTVAPDLSLTQALHLGFDYLLQRENLRYVGWVHPDMTFDSCLRVYE